MLVRILNISPIFNLGSDEHFGAVREGDYGRLSMLSLPFGWTKLYVLTCSNSGFSLWKCLSIRELRPWPTQAIVDAKVAEYREAVNAAEAGEVEVQIDFLKTRINYENQVKSQLQTKVQIYRALVLAAAALVPYATGKVIGTGSVFLWVCVCLGGLLMTSWLSFLYLFQVNKENIRSTFSELRKKSTKPSLATSYYCDWYSSKEECSVLATYVRNIEFYTLWSMMVWWGLAVWLYFSEGAI